MRSLLSTIGSRGDVQPLVALALQLRALGAEPRFCVPPDFREWIESFGFGVTPIGPELKKLTGGAAPSARPTPEQVRAMMEGTVRAQFETISKAAEGCELIVGATALQIAARSIAERLGIRYVFAAFCPRVLPSPLHAPLPLAMLGQPTPPATADSTELWAQDAKRWNDHWGELLNAQRAAAGQPPVSDVRSHIFTDQPWLACDATLGPWPVPADASVFQTGAWLVNDDRRLSPELTAFLAAGTPPLYFGLGSIRAPNPDASRVMIASARALGRRAILSRGWADLAPVDGAADCLAIDEVNQQALFRRVAAVVHHGGAGTTTAAALAGAPQVIVPQMYDQTYWAQRVDQLGIGTAHERGAPTADSLTAALKRTLQPAVADRARAVASSVRTDGAAIAAKRLLG